MDGSAEETGVSYNNRLFFVCFQSFQLPQIDTKPAVENALVVREPAESSTVTDEVMST